MSVLHLVVFFVGVPTPAALSPAMVGSLHEAAPDVVVSVDAWEPPPRDEDAELYGDMVRANAVAAVTMSGSTASVRMFARIRGTWSERVVEFAVADAALERGRTLGFTLAALLPDPAEAVVGAPIASGDAPAKAPERTPAPLVDAPKRPLGVAPVVGTESALSAGATLAQLGGFSAVGASLGARWSFPSQLAIAMEVQARTARIPSVSARLLDLRLAIGLGRWWEAGSWRFGVQADGVVMRTSIARDVDERARFIPAFALSSFVEWPVIGASYMGASVGAEVVPGETRVYVGSEGVLALPPLRLLVALRFGLRL